MLVLTRRVGEVIVIDHDMNFVRQIAQKVTVFHEGHVISHGTVGEVQRDPRVIEVYLGHDRETEDAVHRKPARIRNR